MDFQKYNIKEKKKNKKEKKKVMRIIKQQQQPHKKIYTAFALKIGSFFLKSDSRLLKIKIKGVIEDLKFFLKKEKKQ